MKIDFLTSVRYFGHRILTPEAINNLYFLIKTGHSSYYSYTFYGKQMCIPLKIFIFNNAKNVSRHPKFKSLELDLSDY